MSNDPDRIMHEAISVVEKLVTQNLTTEEMCEVIEAAILAAEEREREACAKLFKQRLEGLATHARNHIHEDQTRFDIRHKARLAVAEELLSWLATAIRGRNSTDE